MNRPMKGMEYILNGNWCIVEDYDDETVYLYFGSHSSEYNLAYFLTNAKPY